MANTVLVAGESLSDIFAVYLAMNKVGVITVLPVGPIISFDGSFQINLNVTFAIPGQT